MYLYWLYEWKKVIKYICIYNLLLLTSVLWIWKHVLQYLPETLEILIYYVFYISLTAINLPYIFFSKSRKYSFLANLLRKITFFLHAITSNVTLSCYRINLKCYNLYWRIFSIKINITRYGLLQNVLWLPMTILTG